MENTYNDQKQGAVEVQRNENGEQSMSVETQPNQQPQVAERVITPRASVYETADEVVLELEMPGVDRKDISINVENDELTIYGRRTPSVDDGFEMLHQERLPLSYRRAFVLSDRIDSSSIKATADCGVLQLILPKAAQAKARKITIE